MVEYKLIPMATSPMIYHSFLQALVGLQIKSWLNISRRMQNFYLTDLVIESSIGLHLTIIVIWELITNNAVLAVRIKVYGADDYLCAHNILKAHATVYQLSFK